MVRAHADGSQELEYPAASHRRDEDPRGAQRRSTAGIPARRLPSRIPLTLRAGLTSSKAKSTRRRLTYLFLVCAVGFVVVSAYGFAPFEEGGRAHGAGRHSRPGYGVLGIDHNFRKLRSEHVARVGAIGEDPPKVDSPNVDNRKSTAGAPPAQAPSGAKAYADIKQIIMGSLSGEEQVGPVVSLA
ncbi:hypothetical protein T484DRAFT_1895857 [Baffinella frigidus]|nr:hypothetical protein T484DRAFT_1895857 [Cryptophyta sp. CCMP2293]